MNFGQQQRVQGSFQQMQQQMQMRQQAQTSPQQNNNNRLNTQLNPQQILQMNTSNPGAPVSAGVSNENARGSSGMEFLNSPEFMNSRSSPSVIQQQPGSVSPNKDGKKAPLSASAWKRTVAKKQPQNTPSASTSSSQNTPNGITLQQNSNVSRTGTPSLSNLGPNASPMLAKPNFGHQQSPSPKTLMHPNVASPPVAENPYKEDEIKLKRMLIKKNEVVARYKHRQEIFSNSPMDLFLCSLADCLGVKDDAVDLVGTIPQLSLIHI